MIRTITLSAFLTLGVAGIAQAQAADPNWTGPYIGVHGGGTLNNSQVTTRGTTTGNSNDLVNNARPSNIPLDRNGGVIGGQLGYNMQMGRWVAGVETDIASVDANSSNTYSSPSGFGTLPAGTRSYASAKMNYLGTARVRFGRLLTPRVLLYGTGGYAYGDVKYRADFAGGTGAPQFSGFHQYTAGGYAVGAGLEYAQPTPLNLLGHQSAVTLRAEWIHYDLGKKQVGVGALGNGASGGYVSNFKTLGDELRGGVNFKF